MTIRDAEILRNFHESYRLDQNRRVVRLPWKPDVSLTSDNEYIAQRRFLSLQKRFQSLPNFKLSYETLMLDYIAKDQVEEAPSQPLDETKIFYLPHHAVKKEKDGVLKWRIVFDASSHSPGSPSLNDALEVGPNLLPEILAALLRFRSHCQAIIGDGNQAFLQMSLDHRDRDVTRFLWYRTKTDPNGMLVFTDEVITYRFQRLPFGLSCSPFLLSASLREVASMHAENYPNATSKLNESLFMDDFVSGAENEAGVISIYKELTALMNTIRLPMAKWASNSQKLKEIWRNEGIEIKTETQALGVCWNTDDDILSTDFPNVILKLVEKPATKRQILRCTSSFYDPLGLFAPVLIVGKLLFQDTWLRGLLWDEILPLDIASRWKQWINEISLLKEISIPRWIGTQADSNNFIHVFCDASERAYGAALYMCTTLGNTTSVRLVCSRNRLAPIKKITLPRLELLAALLGARLLHYFVRETKFDNSKAMLWSDSTVTLGWIRSDPNKWKTFVCNRVTEILRYTNPIQWRHCPGVNNPADCLSRGISPAALRNLDLWWSGPQWLSLSPGNWPPDCSKQEPDRKISIEARKAVQLTLLITFPQPILDILRFSSYIKLLRTTAWTLRFLYNCRSKEKNKGELNAKEIQKARDLWIKVCQTESFSSELDTLQHGKPLKETSKIACFNPFLQDELIRLGGRLHFASLSTSEQHPILLDGAHMFTKLLIHYTHIRLHHLGVRIVLSELRSTFWILKGRQAIKRVLNNCLPCKFSRKTRAMQIEAPLPPDRVTPSKPFHVTGVDFFGPLHIRKDAIAKSYIALFTCATTRAIHLECVADLSTDKFLMAFQRFVGRRGLPHTIYSDNAKTFAATNRELIQLWESIRAPPVHQFFAHHNITWKFIAPRAAWWGGWWERMVGTVKRCLSKTIGKALLSEEELTTVLVGIEAAINSRPLTHDYGIEEMTEPLTPAHFLTGQRLLSLPSGPETGNLSLSRLWKHQQQLLDSFWRRWTKEYLLDLRTYHQVQNIHKSHGIREGDVVLLYEEFRPRPLWKRGRVEKTICGRDGKVRSCVLRTPCGQITRPIQLVIPLEIDQGGEDVADQEEHENHAT